MHVFSLQLRLQQVCIRAFVKWRIWKLARQCCCQVHMRLHEDACVSWSKCAFALHPHNFWRHTQLQQRLCVCLYVTRSTLVSSLHLLHTHTHNLLRTHIAAREIRVCVLREVRLCLLAKYTNTLNFAHNFTKYTHSCKKKYLCVCCEKYACVFSSVALTTSLHTCFCKVTRMKACASVLLPSLHEDFESPTGLTPQKNPN